MDRRPLLLPSAPRRAAGVAVLAAAFAACVLWMHVFRYERLHHWMREDGPFEFATFACYLIAGLIFVIHARRLPDRRIWSAGLALLFLLVAGEEISWGQRMLGFQTPPTLEQLNLQRETTLHNLPGLHTSVRLLGVLFVATVCLGLPLLAYALPAVRARLERQRVPLFPVAAMPLVLGAIALMAGQRLFGGQYRTIDESGEFLLGMAMLAFSIRVLVARPVRSAPLPGTTAAPLAAARSPRDSGRIE